MHTHATDTLTITSRAFYERSKMKLVASIALSGFGLMFLGFCSSAGGNSASAQKSADAIPSSTNDGMCEHLSCVLSQLFLQITSTVLRWLWSEATVSKLPKLFYKRFSNAFY